MMKNYAPSKKLIFTVCGIVLIAAIVFFYSTQKKKAEIKLQETSAVKIQELIEEDIDGDGVRDWEEALWGTNPTKKDSNDNGIGDKEEIDAKKIEIEKENPDTPVLTENETEQFAREFFTTIVTLRESGSLNEKTIKELSDRFSQNIVTDKVLPNLFNRSDLTIVPDTKEATQAYYDRYSKVIKGAENIQLGEELSIIELSTENEDEGMIEELKEIANGYQNIALSLSVVAVPAGIADNHLLFINSMNNIAVSLSNIQSLYQNSLIGLIGVSQYIDNEASAVQSLEQIQLFFKRNGILY